MEERKKKKNRNYTSYSTPRGLDLCSILYRYMKGIDGNFRLQVERYESLELNNANTTISSVDETKRNVVLKHEIADVSNTFCY